MGKNCTVLELDYDSRIEFIVREILPYSAVADLGGILSLIDLYKDDRVLDLLAQAAAQNKFGDYFQILNRPLSKDKDHLFADLYHGLK